MRVALDTNILISAFVLTSPHILKLLNIITEKHEILLATYVVDELKAVTRRKFPAQYEKLETFLYELPFELIYTPDKIKTEEYPGVRDKKDLPVLVSAILADADILLTGDSDLTAVDIDRPEIMTVRYFIERYANRRR
jgi:putative PIN family toxin of toxin-antitoxin system